MLAIDCLSNWSVQSYVNRYQAWKRSQSTSNAPIINFSADGIPCFASYQLDQINNCESPIVVIDNIKEGIHQQQLFAKYRKDKRYLFFSGSQWDQKEYNWGFDYAVVWHNYYWFKFLETLGNPQTSWFYQNKTFNWNSNKPWQFHSLTLTPRPHRVELIELLKQTLKNKNWVLRNNHIDYGVDISSIDTVDLKRSETADVQLPARYSNYDASYLATTCGVDMSVANQCWYNLIFESDFEEENCFTPTEKIYRCLWTGQPFVVTGTKHFLSKLASLGFQTYDSLWDESYDYSDNRIASIAQLCAHLETFDWRAAESKLRSIAIHNRANLLSLDQHAGCEFQQMEQTVIDFCQKCV
jgi:hypothetical protein